MALGRTDRASQFSHAHRWTEHDPEDIWASVTTCIAGALDAAKASSIKVQR